MAALDKQAAHKRVFRTAQHKAAGKTDCPASFHEQLSNPFLVSKPSWPLSAVFAAAGLPPMV